MRCPCCVCLCIPEFYRNRLSISVLSVWYQRKVRVQFFQDLIINLIYCLFVPCGQLTRPSWVCNEALNIHSMHCSTSKIFMKCRMKNYMKYLVRIFHEVFQQDFQISFWAESGDRCRPAWKDDPSPSQSPKGNVLLCVARPRFETGSCHVWVRCCRELSLSGKRAVATQIARGWCQHTVPSVAIVRAYAFCPAIAHL
jgi:hypothetical protein